MSGVSPAAASATGRAGSSSTPRADPLVIHTPDRRLDVCLSSTPQELALNALPPLQLCSACA
jgi:hypothetical protein